MADPTAQGTVGFEFEFFPTAIKQWSIIDIQKFMRSDTAFSSKITGSEDVATLERMYPGCLVIPNNVTIDKNLHIFRNVADFLRNKGIHVNDVSDLQMPMLPEDPSIRSQPTPFAANASNQLYHRWSVMNDPSVRFTGTYDPNRQQPRDHYLDAEMRSCDGLELISPAMTDTPESYQEVVRVFAQVNNLGFLHVNQTAGLHVHVAFGAHQIPVGPLRKVASLLFCLDPFLSAALHPEHRTTYNEHCQSLRKFSNAARGWTFADALRGLRRPRRSLLDRDEPDYSMPEAKAGLLDWVPIPDAVAEIRACKKPEEVAWLMTCQDRANYDFTKFINGTLNPTVEFREHEATKDVVRIVAWGRFCVALVRYAALQMADDDLDEIVEMCHDAEDDPDPGRFYLWELLEFMNLQDNAFELRVPRPPTQG